MFRETKESFFLSTSIIAVAASSLFFNLEFDGLVDLFSHLDLLLDRCL